MYSNRTRELAAFIWLISLCIYGYIQSGFLGVFIVSFSYCMLINIWQSFLARREDSKKYSKYR